MGVAIVLAVVAIAEAVVIGWMGHRQLALVELVLEDSFDRNQDAIDERSMLNRALLARNASEFGNLDRILSDKQAADPRRRMTELEYEDRLKPKEYESERDQTLRGMGYDPASVPAVPEGY